MPDPIAYPIELERDITCGGGARFRLRPIRSDDAPRLVALHSRLSLQTIYQRFFSAMRRLPTDWARYLAEVDYRQRLALVLERAGQADTELVGVGRYEPTSDPDTAEVAFLVEDRWQGKGLGTALFTDLLRAAESRGIRRFRADVLADNVRMLDLIARFGDVQSREIGAGVTTVEFTRAAPGGVTGARRGATRFASAR
jgi:RimJ/RimL family protein N-acetyltransferase